MKDLHQWKDSERRKPLILDGARQVGKTWILKEFGRSFPDGMVYFNFDRDRDIRQLFEQTRDAGRLIGLLSMAVGRTITPGTLIILDEIQDCEEAIGALKYFCEEKPEYYVAASGSFLGLALSKGFPVGKVNHLRMFPMTFSEFLLADGSSNLREYMESIERIEPIPELFYHRLNEKLRTYFMTGGMPEAVKSWTEVHRIEELEEVLEEIIYTYERDMGKHPDKNDIPKIHAIWDSLPSQLAKENKKFMYSVVREGARAREYENALNWMTAAGILNKVFLIQKPGMPLDAYRDLSAFKVYYNDIGIMRRKSRIGAGAFLNDQGLFKEYKGAFTENYVLQSVMAHFDAMPGYWKDSAHEVDYLIQRAAAVFPLEVKSGSSVKKSASIKRYEEKYHPECLIRISLKNLSHDGKLLNVPIFLTDRLGELLSKYSGASSEGS